MKTTLLALDTATEACSVALWHHGEILAQDELSPKAHTRRILPMIDEILAEAGIGLKQVDALVFGRGPGSFTGVRIGSGIAQGLALGADLPVIPVSNLTAMAQAAYQQAGHTQVLAAIDARMDEVYFAGLRYQPHFVGQQEYAAWQAVLDEQVLSPDSVLRQLQTQSLPSAVCVGTGWAAYPQFEQTTVLLNKCDILLPSAKYMLPLARLAWQQQDYSTALEIEPVYLRNQVTWKKLPGRE
ncbi:tRNA threonylcarbamoyladenosine biosynthesis protein TsaB [Pasteurella testudinis DSM 23072]|uniref:tRNA threonylcarbamoyladenosine biosynthesis protein TsaB n=1 Tax=Pasteurella testudinis DSM 23072 TaxID=1122938 RepID=A0A1W1UPS8_9PAST|nr:tRNA (adenosine(37)-N6)-threonylcarbamoyltransferase complex dimerization subunit type 1 TsaB [Pasteurella testudinis]SMB82999.1 tRNA threonylcarbamoyladenosine biosynthesis protein TsaB [Pasteurella testudinis DSM 23072]SUB51537.1 peptidase M22, glycoprotease [Pasteurella testudinis]